MAFTLTSAAGATQAEVTAWDLSNLQLTPPPDYNGGLTLGYLVTATEASNGDRANCSVKGSCTAHYLHRDDWSWIRIGSSFQPSECLN
ncbi:MAG: hypothetical protein AAES65_02620 [Candidatus Thiodiazotropha sp. (ex. Lucinoma kazani)]